MHPHKSPLSDTLHFDVLIVGSGLAGLSAALLLSSEKRVAVITKRAVSEGSSGWAQGGIAAVWSKDDSFDAHVDDTLVAGAGLCDLAATRWQGCVRAERRSSPPAHRRFASGPAAQATPRPMQ